ncbi:MAG TPA: hypothetical protein PLH31_19595, partial [Caulobacter sp.]|nr:hypothetical protein [Caulobacter sp.]
ELPTLINGHKLKVQFDLRNVLNLIDRDWGKVEEYGDSVTLARAACVSSTGAALTTANNATCPAYVYSSVPSSVTKVRNVEQSLWTMQISLRYEF